MDFIKKRLIQYTDKIIKSTDTEIEFEDFKVIFTKEIEQHELRLFGIIIQEEVEPTQEEVDTILYPLIDNPFIGAIHIMK